MSILVAGHINGNPSAQEFEEFFLLHYPMAYRTAYSVTGREEDAEDIVQTVFLKLLRRDSPMNLGNNPSGYIYRAALNQALDTLRRRKRHVLIDDNKYFETHGKAARPGEEEDLDGRLWKAVAELEPAHAEILILRYVHNYDLNEIAVMLGKSRGTVAVSLFRTRSRLKKIIRGQSGEKS